LRRVTDDRVDRARRLYEEAMFDGRHEAVAEAHRLLDGLEADLCLARGRVRHAEFLQRREENPRTLADFQRAAELYAALGDVRGEAEALFWLGTFHQVVRDDTETALPLLRRSYELASQVGDKLTLSYAVRHLGFADLAAGRLDDARTKLEESVALRREIGFAAGEAAGLLALAQLEQAAGRLSEAQARLDEAEQVATACGAHGVLAWIREARAGLG
jgi:tetratricopeptide (TPR) repeat protein